MPRLSRRSIEPRPSGGDRVFTDALGRLWSASTQVDSRDGVTVIFTCITDGRQSGRAMLVGPQEDGDPGDDTLRVWLEAAPRIGRLT